MSRLYEKYVITDLKPELLAFHGEKTKDFYQVAVSEKLVPESNCYITIWKATKIPENNPTCAIHTHEVDQVAIYIGETGTFKVTYALVPPGKDTIDEYTAHKEDEYSITDTGAFYIPKGLRHNVRFDKIDKPIYEIGILIGKGRYP